MFLVGLLEWWYRRGWRQRLTFAANHLESTLDYFSFDLLLKTFFTPFRQDSAGKVNGPLAVQMRALFDNLTARILGAIIRSFMMVVGFIFLCVTVVSNYTLVLLWAVVPVLPLIGLVLFIVGWIPWKM